MGRRTGVTGRTGLAALGIGIVCALSAGLTACAPLPDPGEMRDSLTEVTERPSAPDAAEELDIEQLPDPIASPLACTPYLVVTARGTGEPSGNQLLTRVARAISREQPREARILDLDYPADTNVNEGGTRGVRLLIDTLNVQAESCPDQRFVLMGYSQGALVVGDALTDPSLRLVGATVGELSAAAQEAVSAIVLYGNPRFFGQEPYNSGDFDPAVNGVLPRPLGSLDAFANRLLDLCVAQDFVCQSSLDLDERGHVAYFKNGMRRVGADFVLERLEALPAIPAPQAEPPADPGADTDTDQDADGEG